MISKKNHCQYHVSSPTTTGVQTACHGNACCLATGTRILGHAF